MGTTKKCECGEFKNRGLTVDAVIVRDGKVLLIKRKHEPHAGRWALPGGFVDWDETVKQALDRETLEETGLNVKSEHLFGVYSDPKRFEQRITLAFEVEATGEPKPGDDASEVTWFSLDELPRSIALDHGEIIADAVK